MNDFSFSKPVKRRRVLGIIAGAGALMVAGQEPASSAPQRRFQWQGTALGTDASIILYHQDRAEAEEAIRLSVAEIDRLETEFSLYRRSSGLCNLNKDGVLIRPSRDMVELLRQCKRIGYLSNGAFDVTVQPLWKLFTDHFAAHPADTEGPSPVAIKTARNLVDYRRIAITPKRISIGKGMTVTLNGIAQGYITDRVADLLRRRGWSNVLINLGEIRALDDHPGSRPWRVALAENGHTVPLANMALATSSGHGARFDLAGRHHHLFNPLSGESARLYRDVSVRAPEAAIADALSTAIYATPKNRVPAILRNFGGAQAWLTEKGGETEFVSG